MSDQEHKRPMKDAVNKRREYLRKKAKVIIPAIFTGSMSVLIITSMGILAIQHSRVSDSQFAAFVVLLFLMVPCTIVIISCKKEALSIPDVPPVREQIAALPADKVLLRGSDKPAAAPGELLRAAHEGTESASEELVRPVPD